jgi:hypothetical protein
MKGPGDLILLLPDQMNAGSIEAWQVGKEADANLAWTSQANDIRDACLDPNGGIYALRPALIAVIDPGTGTTRENLPLATWEQGENTDLIRWDEGQLVLEYHGESHPLGRRPQAADHRSQEHMDLVPCDIWHRDHAEMRPADIGLRGFRGHSWSRNGIRSNPIALCARDDGLVGVATSDGALCRWNFKSRRLVSRDRIAVLEIPCDDPRFAQANEWAARMAADCDPILGTIVVADRSGMLAMYDLTTSRVTGRLNTGMPESRKNQFQIPRAERTDQLDLLAEFMRIARRASQLVGPGLCPRLIMPHSRAGRHCVKPGQPGNTPMERDQRYAASHGFD